MEHILVSVFASTSVLFAGLWIHSLVKAAARKKDAEQVDFYRYVDRKSTRLNSSHVSESRMPSSA